MHTVHQQGIAGQHPAPRSAPAEGAGGGASGFTLPTRRLASACGRAAKRIANLERAIVYRGEQEGLRPTAEDPHRLILTVLQTKRAGLEHAVNMAAHLIESALRDNG